MQTEIEAKFLHVDQDALRAKLQQLGATCVTPMRLMKRKSYDYPDRRLEKAQNGWVRVRDEGGKVTLSYKQTDAYTLHGTKEVSLTIDNFEAADTFLRAIGLEVRSYQETRRESWHLDNFEIELDEWPWVDPYVEVEGPDEKSLRALAVQLGLDWGKVRHGGVWSVYREKYDVPDVALNEISVITFGEPVPGWLEKKRQA
jgi:adenylate cyclase, class 2